LVPDTCARQQQSRAVKIFQRVIERLAIVRIGPGVEQQLRQRGIAIDSGRPIKGGQRRFFIRLLHRRRREAIADRLVRIGPGLQQELRATVEAVAELRELPQPGMGERDQRRQLERAAGAIDPSRIDRHRLPQHPLVPRRARDIGVIGSQIAGVHQSAGGNAGPRRAQTAGDVAPVCERKPGAEATRPVTPRERLRLDVNRQFVPGRKAIFPSNAGLSVVQTEAARNDVGAAQIPGGWQRPSEPCERIRIAIAVGAKQILRLLFQMIGIGLIGQLRHEKPPCM
jgi:hypothetical protein